MLVAARKIHHLSNLGLGNLMAEHTHHREALFVDRQHDLERLGVDQIVSFTSVSNEPSQKVMQAIGMTTDPADDFDHPNLPEGHPLRRHVLYRISRQQWLETLRA